MVNSFQFNEGISNQAELDEIKKIEKMLDSDEQIFIVARQARFVPGGSVVSTPNIIFATNKRLIIRNPTMLGFRENIEDYSYDKITNIKLEKGMISSSLVITAPGMGTSARTGNIHGLIAWGRGEDGTIDAIPTTKAQLILKFVRLKLDELKKQSNQNNSRPIEDDPLTILKKDLQEEKLVLKNLKNSKTFSKNNLILKKR